MKSGDAPSKSAAESTILKKDKGSSVSHLCKSSCKVTGEGDRNQHPSETRNSPQSLRLENATLGNTAEAEVAGTVTDAPVVKAAADAPVVKAAADTPKPATSEQDKQQSAFVCAVVFLVLKDCGAIGPHTKQDWEVPFERLVTQTEGLKFSAKFCPNKKLIKKVCKAVVKEMQQRFSREQLASVILTPDPAVETAIVTSIQIHITELAPRYQPKKGLPVALKTTLELVLVFAPIVVPLVIFVIVF